MFKKNYFIPFVVIGDPDYQTSIKIIKNLIDDGADALELGFAFSDPIADGPIIQNANKRALDNKITNKKNFKILEEIRNYSSIPISLMLSYNLAFSFGLNKFYKKCNQLKINGILFPDVPIEENKEINYYSKKYKINQIYLIATNSDEFRIKKICKLAKGYLYLVSTLGTTGIRKKINYKINKKIKQIKKYTSLPIYIGFGISKPKHIKEMIKMGADGVIIGSAICKIIEKNKQNEKQLLLKIKQFCEKMNLKTTKRN